MFVHPFINYWSYFEPSLIERRVAPELPHLFGCNDGVCCNEMFPCDVALWLDKRTSQCTQPEVANRTRLDVIKISTSTGNVYTSYQNLNIHKLCDVF
jgi:hypothetical protein